MTSQLLYEVRDSVAYITLNRPEARNALTHDMQQEIATILRDVDDDPGVRVIVMRGAGEHFCAGGDVKGMDALLTDSREERSRRFGKTLHNTNAMSYMLQNVRQPIVASVRGWAAGGGLGFVSVADFVVASENAQFLAAQIRLGVNLDAGLSYWIPRNIGMKRAKQYALLGDPFGAKEALEMDMVTWVVPDAKLEEETEKVVRRLAAHSPTAIGRIKALINASFTQTLQEQLAQELNDARDCVATDEFVANVRAFAQRGKARK